MHTDLPKQSYTDANLLGWGPSRSFCPGLPDFSGQPLDMVGVITF